jgi:hypothetical protein
MSAEGIRKWESCVESEEVLLEAGEDYESSEMELLETTKAMKFGLIQGNRSLIKKIKI